MPEAVGQAVRNHRREQLEVVSVLPISTVSRRLHYVSRVDVPPARHRAGKGAIKLIEVRGLPRQWRVCLLERLPCFNLVKDLE